MTTAIARGLLQPMQETSTDPPSVDFGSHTNCDFWDFRPGINCRFII